MDPEELKALLPEITERIKEQSSMAMDQVFKGHAIFKAKVHEGGKVTIPEAEMETMDIEEGDIVQLIVRPVKKKR